MVSVLGKLLGDANQKAVKKLLPIVAKVNEFEEDFQKLTDDQLRNKTGEFKSSAGRWRVPGSACYRRPSLWAVRRPSATWASATTMCN